MWGEQCVGGTPVSTASGASITHRPFQREALSQWGALESLLSGISEGRVGHKQSFRCVYCAQGLSH